MDGRNLNIRLTRTHWIMIRGWEPESDKEERGEGREKEIDKESKRAVAIISIQDEFFFTVDLPIF